MKSYIQNIFSRPNFSSSALLAVSLALMSEAQAQLSAFSGSAGFTTYEVEGHHGSGGTRFTFIALTLTRRPIYVGSLNSHHGSSITDTLSSWIDGQFNEPNGPHFIEITSGLNRGFMSDIVDTDAPGKTLTLADDLSAVLTGGESYAIRPHWTLEQLFGANNEAGLGSGVLITADQILLFDPVAAAYTIYYYQTSGLGGVGWRAAGNPTVDQRKAKFNLSKGIVVARKQAANLRLRLFGDVKVGPTIVPVVAGVNFVGTLCPVDTMTLSNSFLYTGNSATGLSGGTASTADQVLLYNGTGYDIYYYQTSGLGGIGWRKAGLPTADASATILPGGQSFVIKRTISTPFFWTMPQTFAQQ